LFTIRDIDLIDSDKVTSDQILVGADDLYKTVCRKHLLEYNKKLSLNLL
jgi:thymidine kinase